jgi:hypothetical protein
MTRRSSLYATTVVLLTPLLLAGCSGDPVREGAEDIASGAVGSASSAAATAVRDEVCRLVGDADLSPGDIQVLRGLVDGAEAAGVDDAIVGPARRIAEAGDTAPADAVAELEEACAG